MRTPKPYLLCLCAIFLFSAHTVFAGDTNGSERYIVTIPGETIIKKLQKDERISEYEVTLSDGRVYGLLKVPEDWEIRIHYDDNPVIEASASHGASQLSVDDINNGAFKEFLSVEKFEGSNDVGIMLRLLLENLRVLTKYR